MIRHRVVAAVLAVAVGVSACSSGTESPGAEGVRCEEPLADPGEYQGLSAAGDVEHPNWVVVSESYADVAPAPLYLHLASGGGDHDSFLAAWRPYLDDLPGLMAMVNTQKGASAESLLAVADQIISDYCVDPDQLHVMGTSWSAGMAVNMACEASGRVASFTAGIGGGAPSPDCEPIRPVPLLSFTGDFDRTEDTKLVEAWVELNGCQPDPTVDDLGSGVAHKRFQQCGADVEFYDIAGMGHAWPLNEAIGPGAPLVEVYSEVDYLDESIRFFAEHSLS